MQIRNLQQEQIAVKKKKGNNQTEFNIFIRKMSKEWKKSSEEYLTKDLEN